MDIIDGGASGDSLWDLRTKDNKLSVWRVGDELEDVNLVVVAFAALRQEVSDVDYCVCSECKFQ